MEWAEYWGAVQEVSDRNGGTYRLPGRPWRFSREKLEPLGDPAFQGEHNRTVFGELGQRRRNRPLYRIGRAGKRCGPGNSPDDRPARQQCREIQRAAIARDHVVSHRRLQGLWGN